MKKFISKYAFKLLPFMGLGAIAGKATSCNGNPPEVQRKDKHVTLRTVDTSNANRPAFMQRIEDYLAKPTTDNLIFDLVPSDWYGRDAAFVTLRETAIQEIFSINPSRLSGNPDIKVTPASAWKDTQERLNQKNFNMQALYLAIRAQ